MYLNDLEHIRDIMDEDSIYELEDIFSRANDSAPNEKEALLGRLTEVINRLKDPDLIAWIPSPSRETHIVVKCNKCLLINIYGVKLLMSNVLFWEGDMCLRKFRWTEEDRLVTFEVRYIPWEQTQTCICHYANDSSGFTHFTEIRTEDD